MRFFINLTPFEKSLFDHYKTCDKVHKDFYWKLIKNLKLEEKYDQYNLMLVYP